MMAARSLSRALLAALLALAALAAAPNVGALQVVDASRPDAQGRRFEVTISQREMTRLAIDTSTPGRITDVINAEGDLDIEKDPANGQVFLRPTARPDAAGNFKPINVFVVTSNGNTHALLMQVRDVPLETVLIKDFVETREHPGDSARSTDRAQPLDVAVRRTVQAMLRNEAGTEFEVQTANVSVVRFANTNFTLRESWRGRTLIGDRFVLVNTGPTEQRWAEQEFYAPGVIAIVVDQHVLMPGEKTDVLVLRKVPR